MYFSKLYWITVFNYSKIHTFEAYDLEIFANSELNNNHHNYLILKHLYQLPPPSKKIKTKSLETVTYLITPFLHFGIEKLLVFYLSTWELSNFAWETTIAINVPSICDLGTVAPS